MVPVGPQGTGDKVSGDGNVRLCHRLGRQLVSVSTWPGNGKVPSKHAGRGEGKGKLDWRAADISVANPTLRRLQVSGVPCPARAPPSVPSTAGVLQPTAATPRHLPRPRPRGMRHHTQPALTPDALGSRPPLQHHQCGPACANDGPCCFRSPGCCCGMGGQLRPLGWAPSSDAMTPLSAHTLHPAA